jgi:phosphocarrier protein HPr
VDLAKLSLVEVLAILYLAPPDNASGIRCARNLVKMTNIVNLESEKPAKSRAERGAITRTFVYKNFRGLHARPAALLVKKLADFKCSITAKCNDEQANAKSLLGLLCLAVGFQSKVTFTATGSDAPSALDAIERLFDMEFEEAYYQGKVEEL